MFVALSAAVIAVALGATPNAVPTPSPIASPTPLPFAARPIDDSQVDSAIDPRFSPAERAIIRMDLLALPPSQRARGVIFRTLDGKFHATTCELLAFELHEQLERAGRTIATPQGPFTQPPVRLSDYPGAADCGLTIPQT